MKRVFEKIGNGMLIGIGILIIFGFGYYMVSARSGLTASPGDKLTASQWNNLISNLNDLQNKTTNFNTYNGSCASNWMCNPTCPTGQHIISGGCFTVNNAVALAQAHPQGNGWFCGTLGYVSTTWNRTILCANN